MTSEGATNEAEALEWTIRVQHPEFEQWDELSAWLAADSRNAQSFHRLTLLDDEVAATVGELPIQPAVARRPPRAARRAWRSWGLLPASVALVLGLGAVGLGVARRAGPVGSSPIIAITTRPGERRDVRLADGTRVAVAGATRLWIDPAARRANLAEGRATFSVMHDPGRRFAVTLGEATISDVGTVFDLRRGDGRNTVAVAQGEVRVEGAGAPLEVLAGHRFRFGGGAAAELDALPRNAVTDWQRGCFNYADAPVAEVVADIEQATGAQIRMSPQVAKLRFAGVVAIGGDAGRTLGNVAPVMGLSVSRNGDVWMLGPAQDPLQR